MTDDLDRALTSEPDIAPSPAFLASVMAAVEREAAQPPPIPFPWLRALPVILMACAVVGFALVNVVPILRAPSVAPAVNTMPGVTSAPTAIWMAIGLLVSIASMTAAAVRIAR